MSANAFGLDWTRLASNMFRFRDPLNSERRFIPLRLDNTRIKDELVQFAYVDWRGADRDQEYRKLLDACRPPKVHSVRSEPATPTEGADLSSNSEPGHQEEFVATPDGVSCRCLRVLTGHEDGVLALALSPQDNVIVSGSRDRTIRIWSMADGTCVRTLVGHARSVRELAIGHDGRLYTACEDGSIGVWRLATGELISF